MSNLKNLIKLQNIMMNALIDTSDQLNSIKEKSKSLQVREAINAVLEAVETLSTNRNSIHGGFYEAQKVAVKAISEQKATAPLHDQNAARLATQEAILKVCEELKASVAKQQEDINLLKTSRPPLALTNAGTPTPEEFQLRLQPPTSTSFTPAPRDTGPESWSVVGRKK